MWPCRNNIFEICISIQTLKNTTIDLFKKKSTIDYRQLYSSQIQIQQNDTQGI